MSEEEWYWDLVRQVAVPALRPEVAVPVEPPQGELDHLPLGLVRVGGEADEVLGQERLDVGAREDSLHEGATLASELATELDQVGEPGHRPVVLHHLADHPGRLQPRQPGEVDGRVLIDGGTTNPLPYDLLTDSCDIVVAIDINSGNEDTGGAPGYFSTLFGSIRIMQQTIVEQQLRASPPDIYIRPDLGEIRTLQFHKADVIYRQAAPAKEELKQELARALAPASID